MSKELQNLIKLLDTKLEFLYNNIKELKELKNEAHEDFERRIKFLESKYYVLLGICMAVGATLPFIITMLLKLIGK